MILRFLRFTFYVASTELPLFVDVAYCYDVCTGWDEGVQLPNMAATQTNGTKWVGARLLCLVPSGTIVRWRCSAWYQVVQSCGGAVLLGTDWCSSQTWLQRKQTGQGWSERGCSAWYEVVF